MSTINGSGAATQNRTTTTFTPHVGGEYGGRYEGPVAAIVAQMNLLIAAGYSVQYECDASPIATLTFNTPTNASGGAPTDPNADFTDNFQVLRNTVQKELLMSDHPVVATVNTTNLAELKAFMADPTSWDDAFPLLNFTTPAGDSAVAATYLFDLFRSGVRSVEVKQPVLRVTRVTNPAYDAPFDISRVDKILTSATMIADSGVPSNFAIPLLALASGLMNATTRGDSLVLAYGWLKDAITSETVGTKRNQYVAEYKFGLWDTFLYGDPV